MRMNITQHGGVFDRQQSRASSGICEKAEAHFGRLDSCGSVCSARLTDVSMSVTASSGMVSMTAPGAIDANVLLTWDGRLDNRSDIARSCNLNANIASEDATVVAQAFVTAGPELWPTLVGDFSVACWDAATSQLYLARDTFGTRPLYYYITDSVAIWCSELSYFVDFLDGTLALDDEFIASYLMAAEAQLRTPYCELSSVPPGYVTVIGKEQVSHCQLWDVASCCDVRMESDAEYEARFRELFAQSVLRRLRTPGVAIAELSGGLDSSSIVCMADQLLSAGKNESAKLITVSYLYDGSHTADERAFISKVEQLRGIATNFIHDPNVVPISNEPITARPSGLHLFYETYEALREMIDSRNGSVLLSGFGGDEVTLNDVIFCPGLVSLLKRLQPLAAFRAAQRWAHAHKTTTAALLWTSAIAPLLPLRLQKVLAPDTLFPRRWMGPALTARSTLWKDQITRGTDRLRDPLRRRQAMALNRATAFTSQCYHREQGCCDVTYPFLDRSLIEFLIGIPADQKLRPTETRSIHRRAMKSVLPEKIRLRKTKQGAEESLLRALSRSWQDFSGIFRDAEVYRRGYIDREAFVEDLNRARHGVCAFTAALARVLSLELWLRVKAPSTSASYKGVPDNATVGYEDCSQSIIHSVGDKVFEASNERR